MCPVKISKPEAPEGLMSKTPLPGFERIKRGWDSRIKAHFAKIHPGQYYVSTQEEVIITVLGSCVSACIWDELFAIGGMNHFMLPLKTSVGSDAWEQSVVNTATRYGNFAMEHLINDIVSHGGVKENLRVKIFGGGKVLDIGTDIGARNIEFVREYLHLEKLNLVAEDVGSNSPRRIHFYPMSGKVMVKKLRQTSAVISSETEYAQDIQREPLDGEIELF